MSYFTQDTYTDTAATSLDSHTPDLGGPASKITSLTGAAQITNANRVRPATNAAVVGYQYTGAPSAADYDVTCDVYIATLTTDSSAAGPIARIQSGAQTFYWGRVINDPLRGGGPFVGYDLYKCVAGTFTALTQSAATLTAGTTRQLKLSVRGTSIILYASTDGGATFTTVCTATDSAISTAGKAGVGFFMDSVPTDSTSLQIDNLAAAAIVTIAPNNPAWFSSPGNWIVNSSAAITTDLGAKRSIVVTGTSSATLTFDLSALTGAAVAGSDYPQIRYSVDGGVSTDVAVATTISLFTSAATTAHEIVYEFVRGNYNTDAYNTPVMAVRETSLILGVGGTVSLPADLEPDLMFVAGDSITAGLAMLSSANPGGGDGTATFAKSLGPALGAEVGPAGKGGVGWAFAGLANVPAFTTEWKNAWTGQPRSFPALKRLIAEMGTNDALNSISDASVTSAVTSWLADARATVGAATWIHVVIPFGGFKRTAITAGYNNYLTANPHDKSALIDLGTLLQAGLSGPYGTPTRQAPFDGVHPDTITHGQFAAALAVAIKSAEAATTRSTNNVGGGVLAGV